MVHGEGGIERPRRAPTAPRAHLVEGLGLTAVVLRLLELFTFDLAGILAAVPGAGSAWLAVRRHETLGRACTFAATELSVIHERLAKASDAQEAISREHTMWRASRGAG
ncbi:hypothetical protein [Streptomyces mutabilis]|uniref:SMODS and SLOG-associating 2TM effector domain-containing protein n=1 Tax=Streptomyces mutabilis TaxID=67332 RepID=A0A086N017_9ACTN|nr:hypothetical protein [Streptomyces mutabilis]KFG74485.1 hypothetical protein FM21_27465 [Streptomyces mutabilis]